MFKVDTPEGERYLVQLVGPASYRMDSLIAYRGQTLTVTKRTRDYLVRKTSGAWVDFDPTPPEPVDQVMPPQFGEPPTTMIDLTDIDPAKNPALTMEQALSLAAKTGPVSMDEFVEAPDVEDLSQKPAGKPETPDESGDITAADLKAKATEGGKKGVTFTSKPKPGGKAAAAMTID